MFGANRWCVSQFEFYVVTLLGCCVFSRSILCSVTAAVERGRDREQVLGALVHSHEVLVSCEVSILPSRGLELLLWRLRSSIFFVALNGAELV
jgi:hypothetical protein